MADPVEITFECLPLRTIPRLDVPIDASPEVQSRCEQLQQAIDKHGTHNSYYLRDGECLFHLTNDPATGLLRYAFEGTVLTDPSDQRTRLVDLAVHLAGESCPWLTRAAAEWMQQSVSHAVAVEFDRYIASGDLNQARARLAAIQEQCQAAGGYLGMYL